MIIIKIFIMMILNHNNQEDFYNDVSCPACERVILRYVLRTTS